jgi:ectoine hydroxylase-related dioxygenase (phytanoyl-CoA dioxygenase family)
MSQHELSSDTYKQAFELLRIGNRTVKRAQEENRKKGIPNVYSFNGDIYYELPNGELTKQDPTKQANAAMVGRAK